MLNIKNVTKKYVTGSLVQTALDGIDLSLRSNEFVAILGPSGSGKTTLLNVIGGLDRYDSGDMMINGVSTEHYTDRDWDSYRNHTIGFVFQSYNLIPHQSILANVELALTISGISRAERRERARKALERVGLGDQLHKRPNQMSGGQMQRVAIARALVNDPEILLADEPTGALDTETGLQVMELLREVAKDRLVVMVTHNSELAEGYATRIVRLKDGRVVSDSDPYTEEHKPEKKSGVKKASMSFLTALGLSANNLRTKKARTVLTSFAGSIGIIGIALILALSSGVDIYINTLQKDTMASYPITISAQTVDLTSMINVRDTMFGQMMGESESVDADKNGIYSDSSVMEISSAMSSSVVENDLTQFKKYIENKDSEINKYIGEHGVIYSYNTKFDVFTKNSLGVYLNTDREVKQTSSGGLFDVVQNNMLEMSGALGVSKSGAANFTEITRGNNGQLISTVILDSYEVVAGEWPSEANQVILVLDGKNSVYTSVLYQLGILTDEEYESIQNKIDSKEEYEEYSFEYSDIVGKKFYLLPYCDYYVKQSTGTYSFKGEDVLTVNQLLNEKSLELEIVGVIRPSENMSARINAAIGYTSKLTDYMIEYTANSDVVKAQESSKDVSVLTGVKFEDPTEEEKLAKVKEYLFSLGTEDKATVYTMIMMLKSTGGDSGGNASGGQSGLGGGMSQTVDKETMAKLLDIWLEGEPEKDILLLLYSRQFAKATYSENMASFGLVSYDAPSSISIYCDSFDAKEKIAETIKQYNSTVDEDSKITYTDYVAMLTDSITTMVDIVSYVLIAFVAVSLVVSCIMIAIITHISVLERTKEIGILRAMGASKRNISGVFNAETFIIGSFSGLIGVIAAWLFTIPINAIIHSLVGTNDVNAVLPIQSAVILVVISIVITVIGGLIPARKAAMKDPVIALRTE